MFWKRGNFQFPIETVPISQIFIYICMYTYGWLLNNAGVTVANLYTVKNPCITFTVGPLEGSTSLYSTIRGSCNTIVRTDWKKKWTCTVQTPVVQGSVCVCVYMYIKDLSNFDLNINVTLHIIQLVCFLSKIQEHPGNVLFIAVPFKKINFYFCVTVLIKIFL